MSLKTLGLQKIMLNMNSRILETYNINNEDVKTRGLEVNVLNQGIPFDCSGVTLKLYIRTKNIDLYEGISTTVGGATGIFEVLYPEGMPSGLSTGEIILENVTEVIGSFQFSVNIIKSLRSDSSILDAPGAGILFSVIHNEQDRIEAENGRSERFNELIETGVMQTNINNKLLELETEYAPRLTEVETQLAEIAISPKSFGAKGDGVTDDTIAIQNAIRYVFDNHRTLDFGGRTYKVSGNNPCGLPRETPSTIVTDNDTNNFNIIGNNARFLWYPTNEDDMFAFVGYLRTSRWQDFKVIVTPPVGHTHYGDIFSSYFGIPGSAHDFSCNILSNVYVEGSHRRTISFDCGTDELQYHDDLTLFEKINSSSYKEFFYTNNSNSVANTFDNCSTVLNTDNSVEFHIAGPWAGGMRITDHHFTIMDCDGATFIKNEAPSHTYATIYVERPRVEVREDATNWKYFDMTTGTLNFNDIHTVNYPIYSPDAVYGIARDGSRITFKDSSGVYTPMNLIGVQAPGNDSAQEVLEFDHCSFVNGNTSDTRQEYPFINYCKADGTAFANRYLALSSQYNYGNIVVKYCTGRWNKGFYTRWLDSYILSNGREMINDIQSRKKHLSFKQAVGETSLYIASGFPFQVPFDIIIEKMKYANKDYDIQNTLNEIRCTFPNLDMADISAMITVSTKSLDLIDTTHELYLKAGTSFQIRVYLAGTEYSETARGITSSRLEITYRLPVTIDEISNSLTNQLVAL